MALHSVLKYSTAGRKARLNPSAPVNSNLSPHAAAAEAPPEVLRSRATDSLDQISFTCQFHLASFLACTKLASAQHTNTLERRPVSKAHLVPILLLHTSGETS